MINLFRNHQLTLCVILLQMIMVTLYDMSGRQVQNNQQGLAMRRIVVSILLMVCSILATTAKVVPTTFTHEGAIGYSFTYNGFGEGDEPLRRRL